MIVDLGVEIGTNTLYLIERGYKVLSCNYVIEVLINIHENINNCYVQHLDMRTPFPFSDQSISIMRIFHYIILIKQLLEK